MTEPEDGLAEASSSEPRTFTWDEPPARWASRLSLAALYMIAGLFHVLKPEVFLLITPDFVPYPKEVILYTGICEMTGAFAILTRSFRKAAGIAFALYAICVYPANIKHAIDGLPPPHLQLGLWYHIPRLMLQPVLVWWALYAGALITWPFKNWPFKTKEAPASHDAEAS